MANKSFVNHRGRKQIVMMFLVYILLILSFAVTSYTVLIKDLKADLGNKALLLAMDITHWLEMDRQEYDRLLALDFNRLLEDSTNIAFEETAREIMGQAEIKYIYLLSELPEDAVKYKVEADEATDYGVPGGTPLTGVYLLDAVLSEELRLEDTGGQGYTDKSRYTVLQPEIRNIMKKREATFIINTDEWGTYLTGYAPYYSEQGEFLGLLGVDLFPDKYYAYIKKSMTIFAVFLFILFMSGVFFSKLLTRVWKAEERVRLEHELSAMDTLTGLINRRRFLGLLTHEYAVCRREGMPLVLMLADLEDFAVFNEVYGETRGNEALVETALFLRKCVKRGSDALCRFGGDEFALMLHNTEAADGIRFAEPLLNDSPHPLSLGILALMPEEALDTEGILQRLEEAATRAKKAGHRKYALLDETRSES